MINFCRNNLLERIGKHFQVIHLAHTYPTIILTCDIHTFDPNRFSKHFLPEITTIHGYRKKNKISMGRQIIMSGLFQYIIDEFFPSLFIFTEYLMNS